MELRNYTEDFVQTGTAPWHSVLRNYNDENISTKNLVDTIQSHYKCCGGQSSNAYAIWMNFEPFQKDNSVPESCCINPSLNCGSQILKLSDSQIYSKVIKIS